LITDIKINANFCVKVKIYKKKNNKNRYNKFKLKVIIQIMCVN